ncbi:RNA polymerase sigma factor [Achromobacter xylosoxidans]|uniref:RNA polymerase sigma factor n=7 Tax=Alcaligenaceae TaxID=506 RepID=UPI0006AC2946|nr:sigma-70 family RNA polymerase sigma factor [Achromobacter xylosoxidans]PWY47568.1 sigma-70 family RNA polymerase sigma factor [Achromobacter sp. RW408]AXA78394.1 sigma-70 family RNA polymerase sigma factor [Achromobacter xylosoxidans]WPQ36653.1 sigma-70 family RNA polymerase sigma factor [Achromobacter xylosoxidans]CUI30570.1 extracytoplasmic-function sigma-70 factor [Achromobacter xylosoxidans]CUR77279.1 extracytoplasmic-function sigma-70 factor [Achromobacter xylosoxidans]
MMNPIPSASRRGRPAPPPAWRDAPDWGAARAAPWPDTDTDLAPDCRVGGYARLAGARPAPAANAANAANAAVAANAAWLDASPSAETAARLRDHLVQGYAALHGRLARRLGCADLASEGLHGAWLRLARPVAGEVANADAYVFRMACHLAIDIVRARPSCVSLDDPEGGCPDLCDDAPGPQARAEARSTLAALARAMDGLSRQQQAVLVALRVEGRSRDEVARWLGLSTRSIDTALRQALRHCAKGLGRPVSCA